MTNFYIGAAWVITFVVVGGYAISLVVRGRRLSRAVPVERRRWMKAPDSAVASGTPVVEGDGRYA